nr:fruit SANT/MYB Binding protein1 [Ipomoea batatas]
MWINELAFLKFMLLQDKAAESSLKNSTTSASPLNLAAYSLAVNHRDRSNCMNSGALHGTRNLLEENNQALDQISTNLSTYKLQDNVDLFFRTRNNITAILNEMSNMPGIMSQMPPLPVFLDEELASSLLPNSTQSMMFGSSSGIQLKQEPGC